MAGATHHVRIDRSKTLAEEPGTGHNRWHEAIPPVVTVAPGDRVILETRDALDGQVTPTSTVESLANADFDPVHPLTGPVYVEGAEPGDLLEVRIEEIRPEPFGFTTIVPGFGFLRDLFDERRTSCAGRSRTAGRPRTTCRACGSRARRSWA